MANIAEIVQQNFEELVRLRRDFHQHPELGHEEFRTSRLIIEYLRNCGLSPEIYNKTGVAALLRGKAGDGPTLLIRADMDALPVQEENRCSYRSAIDGVMHACGHDAHMAMLLIAAKILCAKKDELQGNILFVFQPNEENIGALGMIEEGLMDNPSVDRCMAVHVWSRLETGKIGVKAGPIMAGMQQFKLVVKGKGGHTGTPQSAVDPILISAHIIQAVQAIQTRELDALKEPTVVMFGSVAGGSAANIIPDEVELRGTIRYLFDGDEQDASCPLARFERIVKGVCETHLANYELVFSNGHPALVNDIQFTEMLISDIVPEIQPKLQVEPFCTLAGEDFAEFASRAPGLFYFLGAGKAGVHNYPQHHPRFDIDENVLATGVEIHVRTALHYLKKKRISLTEIFVDA